MAFAFYLSAGMLFKFLKRSLSFCITNDISTDKDWEDIKFGVENQVDFYAVSFVKDADVVHELKDYLRSKVLVPFSSVQ